MKRLLPKLIRLIWLIYFLPLAFMAYYCDFHYGTMAGYILAALLFCLPPLLAPTSTLWVLLPYHLSSLLLSTTCDWKYPQTDRWVNYCKPLTVTQQFIFQHILYLLLGILIVHLWQKKHK